MLIFSIFSAFTPVGDLNLHVGSDPILLSCTLDKDHDFYSNRGLRSDSLFIEQKRWTSSNLGGNGQVLKRNPNSQSEEYKTTILYSEILNETTITAWYNPSTATSDLLGCSLKRENKSPSGSYGICNKEIDVGCKFE